MGIYYEMRRIQQFINDFEDAHPLTVKARLAVYESLSRYVDDFRTIQKITID